jgi:hypothetical protein
MAIRNMTLVKNIGKNYHYSLRNNPDERSSLTFCYAVMCPVSYGNKCKVWLSSEFARWIFPMREGNLFAILCLLVVLLRLTIFFKERSSRCVCKIDIEKSVEHNKR